MPWTRLRLETACGGCPERIPAGAVVYMTKAGWPFCATCGVRVMREPAPMDLPELDPVSTPIVETTIASEFSRFDRRRMADRVQPPRLDARMRQAGER